MEQGKEIEIRRSIHLGRVLGEGGMGRVLDGFAPDLGQHLAVKILRDEHSDDSGMRKRFDEEVAIMASIDHPGNLPVYGTATDPDGNRGYAMKKVEGLTLSQLLAERGDHIADATQRHHLLAVLLSACETVACAHEQDIVHRDLKPDNVLIDKGGSTYVIDWGIAKRCTDGPDSAGPNVTIAGQVIGSPGYMAPEQADGRAASAGPQADVFALGVILYEILTGRRPFGDEGGRAEMLATVHREPEHPRRSNLLLPRSIAEVCLKALHKDPTRRYRTARGLADDIMAHLEVRPVSAVRPNLVERIRYAARRKPMQALLISSAALATLVLVGFILAQMLIDTRLNEKAMNRMQEIDRELAELTSEADELRSHLATGEFEEAERKLLEFEITMIESRRLIAEFEAIRLIAQIAELRFIRDDPKIWDEARERLFGLIEHSYHVERPGFGLAVIESLLERQEEGTAALPLSSADIDKLKDLEREGRKLAGLQ
jgi:serine/threonine protein kinase